VQYWARTHGGIFHPESRLVFLAISALLVPTGLLMFGFGAERHLHWAVLYVGYFLQNVSNSAAAIAMTYVMDSYFEVAAEALLLVNGLKNVVGFGFTYGFLPWTKQAGYEKVCLSLRSLPFLLPRARCKSLLHSTSMEAQLTSIGLRYNGCAILRLDGCCDSAVLFRSEVEGLFYNKDEGDFLVMLRQAKTIVQGLSVSFQSAKNGLLRHCRVKDRYMFYSAINRCNAILSCTMHMARSLKVASEIPTMQRHPLASRIETTSDQPPTDGGWYRTTHWSQDEQIDLEPD
jgi:hypothetical protein